MQTTRDGQRRFKSSKVDAKYERVLEPALRASIEAGVAQFARSYGARPYPDWPCVLDIALRRAGLGSLGRQRWVALVAGDGPRGKERVLELKESLPPSLGPPRAGAARRLVALQRRLQGAPPLFLGATRIGGVPHTVRELQPTEASSTWVIRSWIWSPCARRAVPSSATCTGAAGLASVKCARIQSAA